jgi:hypothetical protein
MVEKDNTDAPLLAMLLAATTVLTIVTILAVIVLFYWKQDQLMAEHEANSTALQGRSILEEQQKALPMEEAKKALLKKGL